ncbi:MAG TPA: OB-fold nucleic acid binding domain-containing protein [Candidatus Bathyarchaeia archaeon]
MATEGTIQELISKRPELTRPKILEALEIERSKTGGLISDETLLRLIAAKHGVQVPQTKIHSCSLTINQLIPILNDATVVGRIVAVYPVRSYEGKQPGKYASLLIADGGGLLRVMLWNDKADLVESGELKAGRIARFVHSYTKEDRNGKTELHIGAKSIVEINPQDTDETSFPFIKQFSTKCREITKAQSSIHLAGLVKEVFPSSAFTRENQSDGKILRFVLADDSGEVTVVAWNERAEELEPILRKGAEVSLVNAKAKFGANSGFEVHIDAGAYIDLPSRG